MSSTALLVMLQAVRMRIHILVLGLALQLMACGDDSAATVTDAGSNGGSGGLGGMGGGAGGAGGKRNANNCPEDKHDSLSAFCESQEACKLSMSERWKKVCAETTCTTSNCYWAFRNACGGYTISHVLGVDVYSDSYHYDADGKLVGVSVQASPVPCALGRDHYGMECGSAEGRLECADAPDAG